MNPGHSSPGGTFTRREFLVGATAAGTALALEPGLFAQPVTVPQPFLATEISAGWRLASIAPGESITGLLAAPGRDGVNPSWLTVRAMPAEVTDILLAHGKISAPWEPHGTEKCAWIRERKWIYAVQFPTPSERAGHSTLRLTGLHPNADVYLNGALLGRHGETETEWSADVTGRLAPTNTLVIHFHWGHTAAPTAPQRKPVGTYLGPNPPLYPVGIFDRALLETWHAARLTAMVVDAALDAQLSRGELTLEILAQGTPANASLRVTVAGPDGKLAAQATPPMSATDGGLAAQCRLVIEHPALWWPRGYGLQALYRVTCTLLVDERAIHSIVRTVGFRHVAMSQTLHFVINGVPIFIRGGAWVTPNLLSRVWDEERHVRLFALAENANFNAFRVWGRVDTPSDRFYDFVDAKGFLLWQDFANLPLEPDERSRQEALAHATRLVKRLKHRPSVLCWCGNNEGAMFAHEDYRPDFTDHGPWAGLATATAVGDVCRRLDPARYYQPTTPYGTGMNPNDPHGGSTHGYTNLWYVPGYDFLNFASEDTRISAPVVESLQRFMAPMEVWPPQYTTVTLPGTKYPFPDTWLPYTTGESWKKTGPVEEFYDAADPAALVYRLGTAAARYYQDTIERQRRGRAASEPDAGRRCGGYLVWKFNDSWPQIYSGKVDYFLEPYPVYYALRRAFAPVLLSFDIGSVIHLWVINDSAEAVTGHVRVRLLHLEKNEFRKEVIRPVIVPPGRSAVVMRLDEAGIRAFRREHILTATLAAGPLRAQATALVDLERRLNFPAAKLDVRLHGDVLHLTADKFARAVTLAGDPQDPFGWFFEDNYFDLLPGETAQVRVLGGKTSGRLTAKAHYSPHLSTIEWRHP